MTTKEAQEILERSTFCIRWAGIALFVMGMLYFSRGHATLWDFHVPTSEDFWREYLEEEHDRMVEEGIIHENEEGEEVILCQLAHEPGNKKWVLNIGGKFIVLEEKDQAESEQN